MFQAAKRRKCRCHWHGSLPVLPGLFKPRRPWWCELCLAHPNNGVREYAELRKSLPLPEMPLPCTRRHRKNSSMSLSGI